MTFAPLSATSYSGNIVVNGDMTGGTNTAPVSGMGMTGLPAGTFLLDDFENGSGSWLPQQPWALTTESARSGSYAWSDSPGGQYGPDRNASLVTPVFDLSAAIAPQLRFWERHDIAADGVDTANVWITTDNQATFTWLRGYSGTSLTWTESTIDLSPYAGLSSVRLVFQLFSNASQSGDGWYIDDVVVANGTDLSPPVVTITSPTSSATYATATAPVSLVGTATDAVGVTQVTCANAATGIAVTASGNWACTIALVPGMNAITVQARDAANNVGTDAVTVTYLPADTVAPTVMITSPTSNQTYATATATITLLGTATDAGGVAQITCGNGSNGSMVTATGTTNWLCVLPLAGGSNAITVTARDAANNAATSVLTVYYSPYTSGTFFRDDMESGGGSWLPQQPWAVTTESARSGSFAWSDSPGGPYGPDRNVSIVTPVIDLSAAVMPQLRFWERHDIAADGVDGANVWVTTDNQATYTWLRGYSGTSLVWSESMIDLSAYAGLSSVQLVFQVFSNSLLPGEGWFIDDVVVDETTPPVAFSKNSPVGGAGNLTTSPILSWGSSSNAVSYEFCYDSTNDNACVGWTSVGNALSVGLSGLSPGISYYWQVRATNASGVPTYANGSNTAFWSFTTAVSLPNGHDFNGDGQSDLLFQNDTGYLYAWFMNGTSFNGGGWLSQSPIDPNLAVVGVNDFTGDGKPDLLVQHRQNGLVTLHKMDGLTKTGEQVVPIALNTPWRVAGTGDLNGDGRADILWQHVTTGQVYVWFLAPSNGNLGYGGANGTFLGAYLRDSNQAILSLGPSRRIAGGGDFDRDGDIDLVWHDQVTGDIGGWYLNGTTATANLLFSSLRVNPAWTIRAVSDYNGDPHPDLIWENANGDLYLWRLYYTTLTTGAYLSPNRVNPIWQIVGPR